ncbi:hypothetical protein CN980_01080 [Bacillus cereus]|uniref:DUF91 domain-containing protein n=1 Tax=Bacillus cereus TaxID=1396 RepID=A0A9X7CFT6_BACCE|nr:hypothetical protein [Bacillus cereus]PGO81696.1 hypothetical protein CN980_01080 [Bacillus cereus]
MTLSMNLWQVKGNELKEFTKAQLNKEDRLENWIEKDSHLLGMEVLIIGKQVITAYGGRIDLLGMDREGNIIIFELKKGRTPRDVIAQALDYATWVKELSYSEILQITKNYLNKPLQEVFYNQFESSLPDELNKLHSIVIVASELDDSSERIIQYLSSEYNININCIFFNFFKDGENEYLGRSWLMDPEEVLERSETKKKEPWTGLYFVNVGEGSHRSWEDCRKFGFISAGQGKKYSSAVKRLKVGDKILAYLKGNGYVGYGEIVSTAVMVKDFTVSNGQKLSDEILKQPGIFKHNDNPDMSEWLVGVKWFKTFSGEQAIWKTNCFANQNIVCRLRNSFTIEVLKEPFEIGAD